MWPFERLRADDASFSGRDPSDQFWYGPLSGPTSAGVNVTPDTALKLPVVYDCLKVLSDTIAALPFAVFQREGEEKKRAAEHPLMSVFNDPNSEETTSEFFGQMVWNLAVAGNEFREIRGGQRGFVNSLDPLDWRYMTVERISDGTRRFRYREPGRAERILFPEDVWHLRVTPLVDGLVGMSPIEAGREAISAALALQDYSARFFKNNAMPPFIIRHPGNFKDDTSKGNFLKAIRRWWGGTNRHSPAVLEYGMEIEKLGSTNNDAQFLETRKEQAIDITRIWRIPPHKVGILDRATFSNIEQQSLEFVIDTLLPWLRLIEKSVNKHLILRPERYFFEFNVAGLLRGDLKARYEAYAQGRNWGWLSVNDIRRLENMNGIGSDGDIYLQPLNMQEAGAPDRTAPKPQPNGNDRSAESEIHLIN